jgi:DNA-binding transcriptional regulator YdaS (Cro superfamily)
MGPAERFFRDRRKAMRDQARKTSKELLSDLIVLAGSQARFASLCGVKPHNVWDWVRNGISRRGAILVASSVEFSDLIRSRTLRPDIDTGRAHSEIVSSDAYLESRRAQLVFEASPEFSTKSPRAALRRLQGE